jgi:chemotaxis protein CheD
MTNQDNSELPLVFLKMGQVHISQEPTVITTLLGSCISVTMFNRRSAIGGMCHGLLPHCRDPENCDKNPLECFKFVDCSVWRMTEQFQAYGVALQNIEVKMFGGANMFRKRSDANSRLSVGDQNVGSAKRVITDTGLNLVAFDVGGTSGRKILFYTHTGRVLLQGIKGAPSP